jgi:Carbohydrate binding module (family 6)
MKKMTGFLIIFLICSCRSNYIPKSYAGKAWIKQSIPGRIECEAYDRGGESVAYHDTDSINNGSGKLNPVNGNPLNEFRMHEGPDISYTKSGNIDNNPYNVSEPELNQLYIGWTKPGEWLNYTVEVTNSGRYRLSLKYTANGDGAIALDLDEEKLAGPLKITSTHNDADTVAWRQWHHWNKLDSLSSIQLSKGTHLLTLHIVENGNMNFDYLEFTNEH